MRFVLDYTVSMRWLLRDGVLEDQTYAERVLTSLFTNEAWVPSSWWIDMTNVISKSEQNNLISQVESEHFLRLMGPLPINERLIPGPQLLRTTLDLTRQNGLSTERAVYLGLAMLENVPLASSDTQLCGIANQLGIERYNS
ncbi:MAG: type II toxin-antitoxin system VapC family toxin [Glaciimonas sp.]|nr:type II toxin-antitoxin system VapC family toxin [Glaciimonas sp.]